MKELAINQTKSFKSKSHDSNNYSKERIKDTVELNKSNEKAIKKPEINSRRFLVKTEWLPSLVNKLLNDSDNVLIIILIFLLMDEEDNSLILLILLYLLM